MTVVNLRVGKLRQVVPDTLEFYFEFVARGTVCEGARLEQEVVDARLRCNECGHEWAIEIPAFRCPECGGSDVADRERRRVRGRSNRGRGGGMHRTKVRIVEDALDANNTIARRQPRGLRPSRGQGRQLHERSRRRQDDAARAGRRGSARRARRRARGRRAGLDGRRPPGQPARAGDPAEHGRGLRRRVPPRREHGALGDPRAAARRDRPADGRERRQPRVPGRVPDRRGRAGDGERGDRGRGQAAEVPADVPRLRARDRQQDRPAAAPRLRPRQAALQHRRRCIPDVERIVLSARTGEGIDAWRDWLVRIAARAPEGAAV